MGKNEFLKHFQENMREAIENLLKNEWEIERYEVYSEFGNLPGIFNGKIDIALLDKENENAILAIEIEHLSSYEQARKNIKKIKVWTHHSELRSCSMIHIFNENSYLSVEQMDNLVEYAKIHEKKGKGFNYDFMFYKNDDRRAFKLTATDFVKSMDFKTRLWLLLGFNKMR